MSWLDKIQNQLIITTGDGVQHIPDWLNAKKGVDYNIAEFDFPNVSGTLVKRGRPIGRKFPIELYFQGDDHLENSLRFEKSARDSRPWTLQHPFYETLIVQPVSLLFDNSGLNLTKITGELIETITEDKPSTRIQPIDAIKISKINLDTTFEQSITTVPTPADATAMTKSNKKNYNLSVPVIKLPAQFEQYNYAFNQANSFVNTATATPLLAIRSTIRLITLPASFAISTKQRIDLLNEQFISLRQQVSGLIDPSSKQIHLAMAGSILSSMCLAASTPTEGDYQNVNSVLDVMTIIGDSYDNLVEDLDSLQTPNGGSPTSFIPGSPSMIGLNNLVNLAISALFSIALGAKQERVIYTETDTNVILLTHRFYGMDPNDNNINEMIINNKLSLNELIQIKKGRRIVYYI